MAVNNKIKAGCLFVVIVWALYSTRDVSKKGKGTGEEFGIGPFRAPYGVLPGEQHQQSTFQFAQGLGPSQEFLAGGGGGYSSGYESR